MDTRLFLEKSWQVTKDNFVMLVVITLVMVVLSTVSLGLLGPVAFAGYTWAILQLVREGRAPRIQDLFSQMQLFLPLLLFALASLIVVVIGLVFFLVPGVILAVAIAFFCLYMVPVMVDHHLGLIDAIGWSVSMVTQNLQDHMVVALIYMGLCWLGSMVAIGWLLTLPFGTVLIVQVYDHYALPVA